MRMTVTKKEIPRTNTCEYVVEERISKTSGNVKLTLTVPQGPGGEMYGM